MKTILALALALSALLLPQLALGAPLQGGYDEATGKLERGFKILASARIASDDECYPAPERIAALLQRELGEEVVAAADLDSVQGFGLVNVISEGTECNRLVLAIRAGLKGRIFVLDSDYGPVYVQGGTELSEESLALGTGPLRDVVSATSVFRMTFPEENARFEVHCPDGTSPLGGGMFNATPLGRDGEGLYPHSYERLGVQHGFHVTPTYVDPSRASTPVRRGMLQVICGRGLIPTASPHKTTFVRRGGTGTVTARCPEGSRLFSGGFQRTNFTTPGVPYKGVVYGGNYITESRAVGNAWRVSAAAVGRDGGELTAIAYCAEDASLPVTEVKGRARLGEHELATAATPRCPRGRTLIAGGFDFGGSRDALFAQGYFTRRGTWAATGYGWFGSAEITAYGYCAKARDGTDRSDFPKQPPAAQETDLDEGGSHTILYVVAGLGTIALILAALLLARRARRD